MKRIFLGFFVLIFLIFTPEVFAQSFEEIEQKSVVIMIDIDGNVKVIHELRNSKDPKQLTFVEGNVSNVKFVKLGIEELVPEADGVKSIVILPNQGGFYVTYDLKDGLYEKNNLWTWNFLYLESTSFILPEEVDLLFVNERPVFLNEQKGITCHGCQMLLEYSLNESKIYENVKWEEQEFLLEIRSQSGIEQLIFDQPSKSITFDTKGENRFVTTIIPLELLWEPYTVFLNEEEIPSRQHINNGTHVWLIINPDESGQVNIIGTTVVPEFPIIAPLAIGFLMILVLPFMKKFSLH